jgi:hypothetical protein
MQSVNAAFTAEEKDFTRSIAESLLISWHRQNLLGNRTFTIGVSTIGGNDIIGVNPGAIGSPGNYKYFDESAYAMSLGWERGYNMPIGGLTMAMAEAILDNTSRRFTPKAMGGISEISTAILPSRPSIINAGFYFGNVPIAIPQFTGMIVDQPEVDMASRQVRIQMNDYVSFFQNKYIDNAIMFTGQRTDQVIQTLLTNAGMNTAQYDLDYGINVIPFGQFDVGTKFADAIGKLVEAENGHFYQNESGIFKFENRQHWNSSPYTSVQRVINTAQVINAAAPDTSHLINVVEISGNSYGKQPEQIIYRLNPFDSVFLAANTTTDMFVNFDDPVLSLTTPSGIGTTSYFVGNSATDGSGTDITSNISATKVTRFAQSAKISFTNSGSVGGYLTSLVISGRVARAVSQIYTKATAGRSVTVYNEQVLTISDNPFIQNQSWAESFAQMILQDFSTPEKLQRITIKAFPELQLGDLISWQGRYWRIFDIKTSLDPGTGFVQELTLLQRSVDSYFRIGISTIGGTDKIAP